MEYEVIVVGGGHAGCEAALASARKGHKTLLVTSNIKNIATMPCNPSIGGSAKGIIVREIDALGGEMGINADKTLIQMKMLNSSKGPAVKSLRAQADKITYPQRMQKTLYETKNLEILGTTIEDLIVENKKVKGIKTEDNKLINSKIVILTTGTYLKPNILIGDTRTISGPQNEKCSLHLSDKLKDYGFDIIRLKTGTPQRIDRNSIDFSVLKREDGDKEYYTFSHDINPIYEVNNQKPCYLTYTNELTHKIILSNLDKSSMYGGIKDLKSIGPRYCPSIEDKVVRFSDKERHQLFLEPESLYYDDIYLQGFSTSMPYDIQEQMVHSLKGLENCIIKKYAYAIEYDAIDPLQLTPSLETKVIENLFTAGQINGTSGYEEAACQGLIAGINAALKLEKKSPLILKRNEAYIGVLIDDLVTKGTKEPYRMLTSRAEYRLILRHDNADIRLRNYGYNIGLINEEKYQKYKTKLNNINELKDKLKLIKITPTTENNVILEKINTSKIKDSSTLYDLLKRTEINIEKLKQKNLISIDYSKEEIEQVEINIKYEGYIDKVQREIDKMLKNELKEIPKDIDYDKIKNIASEARQKLKQVKPLSIGQASRISGVNPADISVLLVYLRRYYNE